MKKIELPEPTALPTSLPLALQALGLSDRALRQLPSQTELLPAGSTLLAQGQRQQQFYFISNGIARACHYSQSGQLRCKEFYFEGEFCLVYDAWLMQAASRYQLEALTDLQIIRLPLSWLAQDDWQPVREQLIARQLLYKERKEAFLLLNNAEERYRQLLQDFPHWPQRLSQQQLANYLGMTAVSLSRIRQRINKG